MEALSLLYHEHTWRELCPSLKDCLQSTLCVPGILLGVGGVQRIITMFPYHIITLVMPSSASLSPLQDCTFLEDKDSSFFVFVQHCSRIMVNKQCLKDRRLFGSQYIYTHLFQDFPYNMKSGRELLFFWLFYIVFKIPITMEPLRI